MKKLLSSLSVLVVACVTSLSSQAADVQGDAKAGEKKNAMCIGCHGIVGYQASFPEIHKVPKISGQTAGYISAALHGYKKGDRKHGSMRALAESLSDQDIADLSAYYAGHGATDGAKLPAEVPAAADRVAEMITKNKCADCHGVNFSTPKDGTQPKVAGQHSDYLLVALKAYKTTGNDKIGRNNPNMAFVKDYSNADLKALAVYLSKLPGDLKTVPEGRFHKP